MFYVCLQLNMSLIMYNILLANSALCLYFDHVIKMASDGGLMEFLYTAFTHYSPINHEIKQLWNKIDVLLTFELFCKNLK